MKLLRTIRFDTSDDHVYELAAQPDEWAVSGAFEFASLAPEEVTGKTKQAFANGFLGVGTFGRSTFACVAEADEAALGEVETALARHFVERYGAPDIEAARPAAREEVDFIADLCRDSLINTIFTVRRHFDDAGQLREEFRTIQAPSAQPLHSRIWSVVDDEA
ncbi:MAG: DUF6505 family protein [Methyloligellaceae bacterium]